ncbi:HNH endonuclease [Vallitalea guaymasensis]|uniref:HNH endonuclease n=1 Tax=Vallitalea guaymasensis TaxID=1185412 RepID=A0A8J8M8C6_9FIRM|nr:HNH endonuclease [Vallitalea guaymasensis]QUH28236.1 HNH endonuclease [Vallitalea guaymasensis]
MWSTLKSFYDSKEWKKFRKMIILQRGPVCEDCGKIITEHKQIEVHHEEILTLNNVNDAMVSLNSDKVKVLCNGCHNKRHDRFQGGHKKKDKNVYIVYGPPCSGKTTYVLEHKSDNDIVVDMDRLYEAVTLLPRYDKPDKLLFNIISVQKALIDNIKTRYGKWNNAWVIGGYADKYKRDRLVKELGAELILIDTDKDECLNRLKTSIDGRSIKEYSSYIDKWFRSYKE